MLSKAFFWEALLNRPGVAPPLVLSIALLAGILHPTKSEDALNQTWAAERRTNMPPRVKDCCWLELRFSHQKQIYTDTSLNYMLGLGPSNRNSIAEFFLYLNIEFKYLELQENLSLDFKHLGIWSTLDYWEMELWSQKRSVQSQWAVEPRLVVSNGTTSNLLCWSLINSAAHNIYSVLHNFIEHCSVPRLIWAYSNILPVGMGFCSS